VAATVNWTTTTVAVAMVAVPGLLLVAVLAEREPAVAICLVPLSLPIGQLAVPGVPLLVVRLATLGAIGLCAFQRLRRIRAPTWPDSGGRLPSPLLLAAGVAVLAALASTLVAADPAGALRLDVGYLLGFGLAAAVLASCRRPAALRLVALALCVGGGVTCGVALATAPAPEEHYGGSLVQNRATGMFGQPNELGSLAAVVAVLALAVLLSLPRRHPLRLLAGAAAGLGYLALAISLSRGAWIGSALGLLVLLALVRPAVRGRVVATLAAGTLALLAVAAALPDGSVLAVVADRATSLVSGQRNPYDDRPAIWQEALRQWTAHPLLGGGPGGYPVLVGQGSPELAASRPDHAHSLALTVGAEQGLVGVAAIAVAVTVGFLGAVRVTRRRRPSGAGEQELLAGAAAALGTVLGQGLVDFPLRNPVLETLTWLLVGLLAAAIAVRGADGSGAIGRVVRVVPAAPSPAGWLPARPARRTPFAAASAPRAGLADRSRCSSP
jgi:putative inorganic carbon (hco3(-)) transporter